MVTSLSPRELWAAGRALSQHRLECSLHVPMVHFGSNLCNGRGYRVSVPRTPGQHVSVSVPDMPDPLRHPVETGGTTTQLKYKSVYSSYNFYVAYFFYTSII